MTDHSSHQSHESPASPEGFIPPHGGYENLLSFQKARIVYDGTVWFCGRCLESATALMTRWSRPRVQGSKTSSKADTHPPEVAANILICLIHQTNYLLDQLIRQLETAFLQEGGLRERMTRARLAERARPQSQTAHPARGITRP
jgi:four helix bundle suffix protein